MKRKQIPCTCAAYSFPHRLSGGKCLLSKRIEKYFYEEAQLCKNCLSNKQVYCEVAEGSESETYGPMIQELEAWNEIKFTYKN